MRNYNKTDNLIISINSDILEEVQDFIYMGSKITKDTVARIRKKQARFRYDEVHLEIQETVIGNKTETVRQ